jgi:hypothetical protein
VSVRDVAKDNRLTRKFQGQLARQGIPIFWFNDLSHDDPDFEAIQVLAVAGIVRSDNVKHLNFNPQSSVSRGEAVVALVNVLSLELLNPKTATFQDVSPTYFAFRSIETLYAQGIIKGVGNQQFAPEQSMTREQFAILVGKVVPNLLQEVFAGTPMDSQILRRRELSRILYRLLQTRLK